MKSDNEKYNAKFKAQVAIEAIKEHETLDELAAKYNLSPSIICSWKKEFLENSAAVFNTPTNDNCEVKAKTDSYQRRINDLQMQIDFAKKVSKKLGIDIPVDNIENI